jgi:ATP-dependent Clp protease adaptor protein ClpS
MPKPRFLPLLPTLGEKPPDLLHGEVPSHADRGIHGFRTARLHAGAASRNVIDVRMPVTAKSDPRTSAEPQSATALALEGVWRVVVLNDPVNLMSYVVLVFKKVFGFDESTARKHMLEVHEQGRSVVWSGLREKAEAYAFTLQQWHLTAVLEPDETH